MTPLLLNDETHEKLVAARRKGSTIGMSAALAGIAKASLMSWLAQGREADRPEDEFTRLARDFDQAHAAFKQDRVDKLVAASNDPRHRDGVRATEFLLSRLDPEEWGERKNLDVQMHTTTDGNPPLSIEQFRDMLPLEDEVVDALPDDQGELGDGDDVAHTD